MKSIHFIVFSLFFFSCSHFKPESNNKESGFSLKSSKKYYSLKDKAGDFNQFVEKGFVNNSKSFATKNQVFSQESKDKILERSILLSQVGRVGKTPVIRPKVSQYAVWFEGEKYSTELKVLANSREILVKMVSPEKQWNKEYKATIPKENKLLCYYSQLIDCIGVTGFIRKSVELKRGQIDVLVIWESYPYFGEQYEKIPDELISKASVSYDGKTNDGGYRFTFNFNGQNIFYMLDENFEISKKFWINQGYSLIRK